MGMGQIILYALGLPLLVFFFLSRHKHELEKPVVRFRYGLFFSGFRKERFYWECIVALRKESIVILAVFGPSMGTSQLAHVALIVILIQVLVQLVGSPYSGDPKHRRLQVLDVASLVVCWVTMWSGYFFHSVEFASRGDSLEILTVLVIIINVMHMMWLIGNMFAEMCSEQKETEVVKNLKSRISFDKNIPNSLRLRVEQTREIKKKRKKKKEGKSILNPSRTSVIESHVSEPEATSTTTNLELTNLSLNSKKSSFRSFGSRKLKKKIGRRKKKQRQPDQSTLNSLTQKSRKESINRLAMRQKQLNWKTNALMVDPLKTDQVEHRSINIDELSGNLYYYDPVANISTWFTEEETAKYRSVNDHELVSILYQGGSESDETSNYTNPMQDK